MNTSFKHFLTLSLALLVSLSSAWAKDPALTALLSGPPAHMGKELPPESYVKFNVRKLKRARILWRNRDALNEKGVIVPDLDDAPALGAFDEEVLGHIGFAVFQDGMDPNDFTDETRELVADRYGGNGIGNNTGSGRAGSTGKVQLKGIGKTPLVGNKEGESHSHGGENFREGQADIVMGEMFNRELPYGANRVLFAVDLGLNLKGEGRRILIVREDPLRPAHFVPVYFGLGPSAKGDPARVKAAGAYLPKALPATDGEKGQPAFQIFKKRLEAYVDRTAEQYAAATAKRLLHGATSPSNFEIDGQFIDFSTATALPGYGPVTVLDHVEPFGDMDEVVSSLVVELANAANSYGKLPGKKSPRVQISTYEMQVRFRDRYSSALNRQFLILAGFSEDVVARLGDSREGRALAEKLQKVAFTPIAGQEEPLSAKRSVPARTGEYDTGEIFRALAAGKSDPKAAERLPKLLPDESLRTKLEEAYATFFTKAAALTPETSEHELARSVATEAETRNRVRYEFFRDRVMKESNARSTSYLRWGNALQFQKSMDEAISPDRVVEPPFRLPAPCQYALTVLKSGWWRSWIARAMKIATP